MTRTLTRAVLVATATALTLPAAHLTARSGPEGTKTLFMSVLDESGKPVKDMTADDIRMREDGKDVQIVSVGPAQDPLHIVMLVDTSDSAAQLTSDIRRAVTAFIKQVHTVRNDAAIELMEFGQAAVATTPFTSDDDVLTKALGKMVSKPGADAVMLEALRQAATDLGKVPSPRRAVVSFNTDPSHEIASADASKIRDAYAKSIAQLWSVTLRLQNITIQAGKSANGKVAASDTIDASAARNGLIDKLTQWTGGQHEIINSAAAMEGWFQQYADALTYQYAVVYRSNTKNAKNVQLGTVRQGVKLHASGFPPQQ
jgi:VWFA-related protein